MFADYLHSENFRSHTVKDHSSSSGTKQNPTRANNLTKVGSTWSRKNTDYHAGVGPLSRDPQYRTLA
jgi:hypothetical protein